MRSTSPKVVVVGSLNIDYIASVERLPASGQTVAASLLIRRFGGKGANQAIAAARQGAKVRMLGSVGAEEDGRAYRERLTSEGINVSGIGRTRCALTGTALIAVDQHGENTIIVAPGANGEFTSALLRNARPFEPRPDVLLLQFEIPMLTVSAAVLLANQALVPVVLNPSPLRNGFPWGRCSLDTLIVNAGEARDIFNLAPEKMSGRLSQWRNALTKFRIERLIITRGAEPTLCLTQSERYEVPTLKVKPVDTVGAGDAFAGTYAAGRAAGLDLRAAIRLANCAGALTTQKAGAQEAIPTRRATRGALRSLA